MRIEGVSASQAVKPLHMDTSVNRQPAALDVEKHSNETQMDKSGDNQGFVDYEQLREAVDAANKTFKPLYRQFDISVHEQTNKIMVKVIDKETEEIIREIPPEKILDMVARMWEIAGIIVDEKI